MIINAWGDAVKICKKIISSLTLIIIFGLCQRACANDRTFNQRLAAMKVPENKAPTNPFFRPMPLERPEGESLAPALPLPPEPLFGAIGGRLELPLTHAHSRSTSPSASFKASSVGISPEGSLGQESPKSSRQNSNRSSFDGQWRWLLPATPAAVGSRPPVVRTITSPLPPIRGASPRRTPRSEGRRASRSKAVEPNRVDRDTKGTVFIVGGRPASRPPQGQSRLSATKKLASASLIQNRTRKLG